MTKSTSNLYFNVWDRVETYPNFLFYIFIGGRGIGKTFSALWESYSHGKNIMYLRRTETELTNCATPVNNPYKKINLVKGTHIELESKGSMILINDIISEDEKENRGVACALSTFGKFRGTSFDEIEYIIFDEFIPMVYNKDSLFRNELFYLYNLVETINRNREIEEGRESVKVLLLANTFNLDSSILTGLNLGHVIHSMVSNGIEVFTDEDRGIYIELPQDVPISEKKKNTALYRLSEGSRFYDMSISNEFKKGTFDDVKVIRDSMLTPFVGYKNVTFYYIKDSDYIYASYRKNNDVPRYNDDNFRMFQREWGAFFMFYIEKHFIYYHNLDVKIAVQNIF